MIRSIREEGSMNTGRRAGPAPIRAAALSVLLLAALTGTTGHGAPGSPDALVPRDHPQDETHGAPRPPFVVTTEVTVVSSAEFAAAGRTTHRLAIAAPPYAGATLELLADGAFGTAIDRATASAEGIVDTEAAAAGADCRQAAGRAVIPAGDLERIAADGTLEVTVRNSASVAARCATNRHTIRLRYEAVAARLDFPPTRVGSSTTLGLMLHPRAPRAPVAVSIASDRAAFVPSATMTLLPPDGAAAVTIRFAPESAGRQTAQLTLAAGGAPVRLTLTGTALDPPAVGVDPGALDAVLPVGGSDVRAVQVTNLSGRTLDLTATVEGSAGDPGGSPACASPAVYVLEGVENALARVDLHTGEVTHVGPQIFGASALALTADASAAYVTTFAGEVVR